MAHTGIDPRQRARVRSKGTLVISAAVFVGMLFLFGFLGTLVDANGVPYVEHFSPLAIQIVGTAGVIVPALLPYLIRTHKASEATKEQVKNDHPTNMRDENDERHQVIVSGLSHLDRRLGEVTSVTADLNASLIRLWHEVNKLGANDRGQEARIHNLEDTINPKDR